MVTSNGQIKPHDSRLKTQPHELDTLGLNARMEKKRSCRRAQGTCRCARAQGTEPRHHAQALQPELSPFHVRGGRAPLRTLHAVKAPTC